MINTNYEKLLALNLPKMAEIYKVQANNPAFNELSFDEKLAFMIDEETTFKTNTAIAGLKKRANLKLPGASLEDVQDSPDHELDKTLILKLSDGDYIDDHLNVCILGATGCGKTFMSCALGNNACMQGKRVKYVRMPDFLYDIDQARKKEKFKSKMNHYTKPDLLIIDDWLLTPTTSDQQADLLELIERRSGNASTIFASQLTPEGWHKRLGGGALADSVVDRITSAAYFINIKGDKSMRSKKLEGKSGTKE